MNVQNSSKEVASPAQDAEDDIDLFGILQVLWASKGVIAASTAVGLTVGSLYATTRAPVWQADALVQIESRTNRLALPEALSDLAADTTPSTLAEIEILRSRSILQDAAAALRLDWHVAPRFMPVVGEALHYGRFLDYLGTNSDAYPRIGETIELAYLQVPPEWIGRKLTVTILEAGSFAVELPDQTRLEGEVGKLLSDISRQFAITVAKAEAAAGRQFEVVQSPEMSSVGRLASSIGVSEQGRQTGILRVSMTAPTPEDATRRLDAVLTAYTRQSVTKNAAEASQSLRFVEEQLPIAEAQVRQAETDLNAFRSEQKSIDLSFETQNLLNEAASLEGQIQELLVRERELGQRFTQNHPIYRQAIENRLSVERRLTDVKRQIEELPETQREVVNLTRTLEVAQSTYLQLLNRAQELRVLQASEIGNVRVVDTAQAGGGPIEPRKSRLMALAGLLGLLAGTGGALLRNWMRHGIDTADEIEQIGFPVIGITTYVPQVRSSSKHSVPLVVKDDPEGLNAEAFRSVRTALRFLGADGRHPTLAITSPMPGAGKSFCAANLAIIVAHSGQRVCLVDADLRRGVLARSFGLSSKQRGLADHLVGEAALKEIIYTSGVPGLDIITTGKRPPNPSELLMRDHFSELCDVLSERYDLVIFDTPPILLVTDAAVISRMVSQTIAVARHAETELGDLVALRKVLQTGGGQVHGAILNAFDPRKAKPSSYRYGRYGYGYGYRYRYAYRNTEAYRYSRRNDETK